MRSTCKTHQHSKHQGPWARAIWNSSSTHWGRSIRQWGPSNLLGKSVPGNFYAHTPCCCCHTLHMSRLVSQGLLHVLHLPLYLLCTQCPVKNQEAYCPPLPFPRCWSLAPTRPKGHLFRRWPARLGLFQGRAQKHTAFCGTYAAALMWFKGCLHRASRCRPLSS